MDRILNQNSIRESFYKENIMASNDKYLQKNFLDYTKLTYSDIITQIRARLDADSRFENFSDSAIAKMVFEIFAATADLTNYYIERRAEECFFDTARLRSSVILLAKGLGYTITRPIPATTTLLMKLKGPLPAWTTAGEKINLSAHHEFTHDGNKFILANTYAYTFTSADVANGIGNSDFEKDISYSLTSDATAVRILSQDDIDDEGIATSALSTIGLIQGELKTKEILANNNPLVGQKFQKYKIDDKTFSNKFGSEDYGSGDPDSSLNVTFVGVTTSGADAVANDENTWESGDSLKYKIDRRSLINQESLAAFNADDDALKLCTIRTSPDEGVEVVFGDGNYAKIGADATQNIYVRYLSTLGAEANKVGVNGAQITTSTSIYVNSEVGKNITDNLEFYLNSNITDGADMESVESIKQSAPALYYALDRLVTSSDYINYLKSLTSPINIKNAIAWGEQEDVENDSTKTANIKLFNIVLFSVLGYLYDVTSSTNAPKIANGSTGQNIEESILDEITDIDAEFPSSYFNILIKETTPTTLGTATITSASDVNTVLDLLASRSQLTLKNVYLSPRIQTFNVSGTCYVNKFASLEDVRIAVSNKIYQYLNVAADFNSPVYKSKITEIIESFKEIEYVDFDFTPKSATGEAFDFDNIDSNPYIVDWVTSGGGSSSVSGTIAQIYEDALGAGGGYYTSATGGIYPYSGVYDRDTIVTVGPVNATRDQLYFRSAITEYTFNNLLLKDIYYRIKNHANALVQPFADTTYFNSIVTTLRNSFAYLIKYNLIDLKGNITGYTIKTEVPQLYLSTLTFQYKS